MDISDYKVYDKISHWIVSNALRDFNKKLGKPFWHGKYRINTDPAELQYMGQLIDQYIAKYGEGPHDVQGTEIKVGDQIAIALHCGNSSAYMKLDRVESIKKNGPAITHVAGVDRTYRFPERMVVLK